jgi:hypothetical protein
MADWTTIASLATAGGTLVLALATFASVRSAQRVSRTAEEALLLGQRPLLMPSRLDAAPEKIMFVDEHWVKVEGGRASVELADDNIYLAASLRNVGNGIAVLQGWRSGALEPAGALAARPDPQSFRPQTRDLYVPPGDVGFWQAGIRDPADPDYAGLRAAIEERRLFMIALLYSDNEGGQRAIGRFVIAPSAEGSAWLFSLAQHWNVDRPNPR